MSYIDLGQVNKLETSPKGQLVVEVHQVKFTAIQGDILADKMKLYRHKNCRRNFKIVSGRCEDIALHVTTSESLKGFRPRTHLSILQRSFPPIATT
jgi:hypothetical protein